MGQISWEAKEAAASSSVLALAYPLQGPGYNFVFIIRCLFFFFFFLRGFPKYISSGFMNSSSPSDGEN